MNNALSTMEQENHEHVDWSSIPVNSYVDAGEHGLFLKLTPDTFVPVKVDGRGHTIGYGTSIAIDQLPEVNMQRLSNEEIASIPERHSLPSLRAELTGKVGEVVSNLMQKS